LGRDIEPQSRARLPVDLSAGPLRFVDPQKASLLKRLFGRK